MPLQATSGAASYDAFGGGVPAEPNYIESCFSTWLYTGNGGTSRIRIQNGVDVLNKGGLVWIKNRGTAQDHYLTDTARGMFGVGGNTSGTFRLSSNNTAAQIQDGPSASVGNSDAFPTPAVPTDGFFINADANANSAFNYVSWTFREQPKFFDVVTYTGNGVAGRTVAHNLGSVPGCIIIKQLNDVTNWITYHRANTANPETDYLQLNSTAATIDLDNVWNDTAPTSTVFTLGINNDVNKNGGSYVAYLFAHNAGGFGLTGTDNVISCGSFTTNGSGGVTGDVTLGYEPQWLLVKQTNASDNWYLWDTMRGFSLTNIQGLYPNLSAAEGGGSGLFPTATGFAVNNGSFSANGTFIYIAIRRGPMKVPTTGTSVFSVQAYTGNDATRTLTTGFPVDLAIGESLSSSAGNSGTFSDRLRGTNRYVNTASTGAEVVGGNSLTSFAIQNGVGVNGPSNFVYNLDTIPYVLAAFRRAPGYMDVVCWTGDGTGAARNHNLTVYPELVISKLRAGGAGFGAWSVQNNINPSAKQTGVLNTTAAFSSSGATSPTATVFYPTDDQSGATYVTYLFASAPGVSKVGSFTGTGATQVINCGFTAGARFVLIKATSTTGDWYVWDSARGIVAGNDPYLRWNVNGNQVTNTDWVDTAATGFELSNAGGNLANSNGVSYVFLAVA